MLLTRDEMHFDFKGAKLDPVRDRDVIAWAVQQFLYGEVTGIQVGHWLYNAPDLDAARFLAKQAVEEFQHVGNFLRILEILGVAPAAAHPVVRFLSTGMMSGGWEEHVAIEMALGEGLVLQAFYALVDLVAEPEIVAILQRGVRQEEGHVAFGERRTQAAVAAHPELRRRLLGIALVSLWGVRRLGHYMRNHLPAEHPALRQIPAFVTHALGCAELRLQRMGLLDGTLGDMSPLQQGALVAEAYGGKALAGLVSLPLAPWRWLPGLGPKRLTETYLTDPFLRPPPAKTARAADMPKD